MSASGKLATGEHFSRQIPQVWRILIITLSVCIILFGVCLQTHLKLPDRHRNCILFRYGGLKLNEVARDISERRANRLKPDVAVVVNFDSQAALYLFFDASPTAREKPSSLSNEFAHSKRFFLHRRPWMFTLHILIYSIEENLSFLKCIEHLEFCFESFHHVLITENFIQNKMFFSSLSRSSSHEWNCAWTTQRMEIHVRKTRPELASRLTLRLLMCFRNTVFPLNIGEMSCWSMKPDSEFTEWFFQSKLGRWVRPPRTKIHWQWMTSAGMKW